MLFLVRVCHVGRDVHFQRRVPALSNRLCERCAPISAHDTHPSPPVTHKAVTLQATWRKARSCFGFFSSVSASGKTEATGASVAANAAATAERSARVRSQTGMGRGSQRIPVDSGDHIVVQYDTRQEYRQRVAMGANRPRRLQTCIERNPCSHRGAAKGAARLGYVRSWRRAMRSPDVLSTLAVKIRRNPATSALAASLPPATESHAFNALPTPYKDRIITPVLPAPH